MSNPADLLLRIARTPDGLRVTSPQLPNFVRIARGPIPIAQAVDSAWIELACALNAANHGEAYDLVVHDMAAAKIAQHCQEIRASDVAVVAAGAPRRESGGRITRHGVNGPRHDPFAWIDLGNGYWQSPAGGRYPDSTQVVQRVIAARSRTTTATPAGAVQQSFDDVAS